MPFEFRRWRCFDLGRLFLFAQESVQDCVMMMLQGRISMHSTQTAGAGPNNNKEGAPAAKLAARVHQQQLQLQL
jgi:hypothetical protein